MILSESYPLGKKINLTLNETSKLHLESEKSIFNLNCLSPSEFPLTDENFNQNEFSIKSKSLLGVLIIESIFLHNC